MAALTGSVAFVERSAFMALKPARASSSASAVSFSPAQRSSSLPIATPSANVTGSGIRAT